MAKAATRKRVRIDRMRRSPLVRGPESSYVRTTYGDVANAARSASVIAESNRSNIKTGGISGIPSVGGLFGNLGRDALSLVTGLPSLAELAGRNVNAAALEATGLAAAGRAGVPGLGWAGGVSRHTLALDRQAGQAMGHEYATRYGPLAAAISDIAHARDPRYDLYRFAEQATAHPGFVALDVATAFSGAGALARVGADGLRAAGIGAEGGTLARIADRSVLPAGESVPGGRVSTGARHRPPKVLERSLGENTDLGGTPVRQRIEIRQRERSANPLRRAVQTRVTEPFGQSFSRFLEAQGNRGRLVARPFSSAARWERANARVGRDLRYSTDLERAKRLRVGAQEYLDASKAVVKEYGDAGAAAIRLHAQDLLDVPGMGAGDALKAVSDFMYQGLDRAVREHGIKSKGAAKVHQAIESIPPDLLNLDTAPVALQRAVQAARELSQTATEMRVQAGAINPATAAAIGSRAAEQVFGGSRYSRNYVRPTERVVQARQNLALAIENRAAGPRLTPLRAVRRAFTAGRRTGRGERNLELAGPQQGTRRVPIIAGTPGRATPYRVARLQRGPGVSAGQGRAFGQQLRGRGRLFAARSGMQESTRLTRDVQAARHELSVAQREARGGFTPPTRTDVGRRGVYFPDRPVDRLPVREDGQPAGAFGRLTQDKVHESHGVLFGMGNTSIDPRVLVQALDRALVDGMHPGFVRQVINTFAFKTPDGVVAKGDKAIMAMKADPEHVVLMSEKRLHDATRLAQDLPEGVMPDDPFAGAAVINSEAGVEMARAAGTKDFIALPKAAVDAVRQGYSDPARIALYDTPLQLWRRGILAFTPRWYLNNLFGNTFQFGLLTGGDFKAIRQASMDRLGGAVPEQIAGSTIVNDIRMSDPTAQVSAARAGYEHASNVGMDFNQKLESTLRRAAYIARAKRNLKAEGVDIGKMSEEELGRAIESMPPDLLEKTINDVQLFMGDYTRMHPNERMILKRIFPFYSWFRVIGKFMGVVPFRHPKRVALVAAVSAGSAAAVSPENYMLPIFDRGRIHLPGDIVLPTTGSNPLFTHAQLIANLASGSPQNVVSGLTSNITPFAQPVVEELTGRNVFGRDFTAPPGANGTVQAFGGEPTKINPATGLPETVRATPSLGELIFQTLPVVPSVVRGIASGGRTPYDTTPTWDLVARAKPDWQLFRDSANPRGSNPLVPEVSGVPVPLNPVLSLLGLNFKRRDVAAERATYERGQQRYADAQRQTLRRITKVSGGR